MHVKAIVGGKVVSFTLSPELARANGGKTTTDEDVVAFGGKPPRAFAYAAKHGAMISKQERVALD